MEEIMELNDVNIKFGQNLKNPKIGIHSMKLS